MAQDPLDAVAAVQTFLAAYCEIRAALLGDLAGLGGIADLMRAVRTDRVLGRQGTTTSGVEYLAHGAGCRMTDRRGREVDVDLRRDPATGAMVEAADVWRIQQFLASCAAPAVAPEDLDTACHQLSDKGALRVLGDTGWFALDSTRPA
ncbi:hypothetical protein Dvina_19290 [Dactylosporangium vinaceum]|uniref:DUF6896 domain-containing protein n=1 Tax=Dactylosporangium vinaceum TaxID=53362 RepID=A0ABV5M9F5_9ACTN|nr:hypothetical protein [Dactylosporangium vinaceum]UAC00009.1 hypothetical protein Dvina_19290 [Dactylosporangium vinaceum]